jgi:hypothetical protein
MAADAGLDARLLVGAQDAVERVEAVPVPGSLVQVEDPGGLAEEVRVPGEEPVLVLPRLDGVRVQEPGNGGATDRLAQVGRGVAGQVG